MRSMRFAFLFAVNTLILMALPGAILAQGVDDQMLLHPPADSWPGYHGDYSGRRHSPLTQIMPENVKNLSLAWAFQTNQAAQIKSSPLMVDGILYFTVPDNIWAVDARSGQTGLFIVDARQRWSIYFAKPADGVYGWAGADYDIWGKSAIEAIDYQTGKFRWTHEVGEYSGAGVLTTDSGLTFTGDTHGNILALETSDGKTLWHSGTGAPMQTSPITYELDGRQYVVTGSGGVMFAWALP